MTFRTWLRDWLIGDVPTAPAPASAETRPGMHISLTALAEARAGYGQPLNPFVLPEPAPHVLPAGLTMDAAIPATIGAGNGLYNWAAGAAFGEGIGFLGYTYLAELSQRPEYRQIVQTWAREATRKWIKIRGENHERIAQLEDAMRKWRIRETFRDVLMAEGFFGRAHLYIDTGRPNDDGAALPLTNSTIGKGRLKGFRVVEPLWTYPAQYEARDPLSATFYDPQVWHVMGRPVHKSRLLTFVAREVPDILKPAYAFGGLSLSQMVKPYVDNWLRTRQAVSDLVHSFSVMVLKTNMSAVVSGAVGAMRGLLDRIFAFNTLRDNQGTMAIDKDTEELENLAVPLGTLDKLQAQSQEQIASVAGIPLVVLLGVTPSGLNASSDGEVRSFYAAVKAYQEHACRAHLTTVIQVIQLSEFGSVDETISFEFEDLWEMDDTDRAAIRKSDAEADATYINAGVVSNEETRERLSNDETSLYHGVDLSGPPPEPEPEEGADDGTDSNAK